MCSFWRVETPFRSAKTSPWDDLTSNLVYAGHFDNGWIHAVPQTIPLAMSRHHIGTVSGHITLLPTTTISQTRFEEANPLRPKEHNVEYLRSTPVDHQIRAGDITTKPTGQKPRHPRHLRRHSGALEADVLFLHFLRLEARGGQLGGRAACVGIGEGDADVDLAGGDAVDSDAGACGVS